MHVYRGYYKIIAILLVGQGGHTRVWYGLFGISLFVFHCIMYTKLIHYVQYNIRI